MMTDNVKCNALMDLLKSYQQQFSAVNVSRLFGWGNSRTLRLMVALQEAGLTISIAGRPGQFTVNVVALENGFPQNIIDLVCDVMSNDTIGRMA